MATKYVVRRHYEDGQTLEQQADVGVEEMLTRFEDQAAMRSRYGSHVKRIELLKVTEQVLGECTP